MMAANTSACAKTLNMDTTDAIRDVQTTLTFLLAATWSRSPANAVQWSTVLPALRAPSWAPVPSPPSEDTPSPASNPHPLPTRSTQALLPWPHNWFLNRLMAVITMECCTSSRRDGRMVASTPVFVTTQRPVVTGVLQNARHSTTWMPRAN